MQSESRFNIHARNFGKIRKRKKRAEKIEKRKREKQILQLSVQEQNEVREFKRKE